MSDKPPAFSALRAVEAATRHRSFTWAARELNITHSAVSQSIRRLESELGATLFERKGGAMQPSDAAMRLAQSYAEAAESLNRTIREISGSPAAEAISLAMSTDLARLWFAPRLGRFSAAMPDVRIDLMTQPKAKADASLTIGDAIDGGERLAEVVAWPVAAPAIAGDKSLARPDALAGRPLLAGPGSDWAAWAASFRIDPPPVAHAFDDTGAMLEAAAQGAGVALADQFVIEPYVEAGRLKLLPHPAPTGRRLVLTHRGGGEVVERLAMWLKIEIARAAAISRVRT
jgi:LysR family glycine cleavage system transcriptional activator